MTPERLREILDALGWNATALARRLGMARERSAKEWLNGRRPIPQPVVDWLELMHRHDQTAPPPPTPPRS
jgi:transcriptional regulator with XRE-family HTH domain